MPKQSVRRKSRSKSQSAASEAQKVPPPEAPIPNESYLTQASSQPRASPSPRPLLIVLDLNGTLIHRKHRGLPPKYTERPFLRPFLDNLFANYSVMIWTSSRPKTVEGVLQILLPESFRNQLLAVWARDKLGLTPAQYAEKVQVYKRLDEIWRSAEIQSKYPIGGLAPNKEREWDQTNTILIDDSWLKAIGQPYNSIEIPEFTARRDVDDSKTLWLVLRQLRVLSFQKDVSRKLHQWAELKRSHFDDPLLVSMNTRPTISQSDLEKFWDTILAEEEKTLDIDAYAIPSFNNGNKDQIKSSPAVTKTDDLKKTTSRLRRISVKD